MLAFSGNIHTSTLHILPSTELPQTVCRPAAVVQSTVLTWACWSVLQHQVVLSWGVGLVHEQLCWEEEPSMSVQLPGQHELTFLQSWVHMAEQEAAVP